jgi:hypothetical protein
MFDMLFQTTLSIRPSESNAYYQLTLTIENSVSIKYQCSSGSYMLITLDNEHNISSGSYMLITLDNEHNMFVTHIRYNVSGTK